ncbi:MAG: hypothetical protein ACO3GO_05840 [Terrimicrobiaceae bacterium]
MVEARQLTGGITQIRTHLRHLGHPIVADPVYLKPESQTLHPSAPPMCLHAHRLAFRHPIENKLVRFESPAPGWAIKKRFAFDPPE